jgi:hypothetical protein
VDANLDNRGSAPAAEGAGHIDPASFAAKEWEFALSAGSCICIKVIETTDQAPFTIPDRPGQLQPALDQQLRGALKQHRPCEDFETAQSELTL